MVKNNYNNLKNQVCWIHFKLNYKLAYFIWTFMPIPLNEWSENFLAEFLCISYT